MKTRCSADPTAKIYADYYGRGIRICERWLTSFTNFRDDVLPIWEKTWKLGRKFGDTAAGARRGAWAGRLGVKTQRPRALGRPVLPAGRDA
jgi:hypothetical protein